MPLRAISLGLITDDGPGVSPKSITQRRDRNVLSLSCKLL